MGSGELGHGEPGGHPPEGRRRGVSPAIRPADRAFDAANRLAMILVCASMVYPFLHLVAVSLSPSSAPPPAGGIVPAGIDLVAYARVFASQYIGRGFVNTVQRTLLGVAVSVVAVLCTAYPLSKRHFPNRTLWTGFVVFTMFFGGGLIPTYLLVRNLGLMDRVWALVLPGLIPSFTMIIVRNAFMAIPDSLEESAKMDGANDIAVLFRIVVPISLPIVATVVLWQGVAHWNAWFDSLIYIQSTRKQVLQVVLRRIVLEGSQEMIDLNTLFDDAETVTPETVKAATVIVATVPIILLYPLAQRYFMQGILTGSLKG